MTLIICEKGIFFSYIRGFVHLCLQTFSTGMSDHQLVELLTPSDFERADKVINFGRKGKFGLNIHVKLNCL